MRQGEHDVGHAALEECVRPRRSRPDRGGRQAEPFGGDRGEQAGLVAELVRQGRMRHAGAARDLTHAHPGSPDPVHLRDRSLDRCFAEVAVVIRPGTA
jgi:hypothetical protein